MTSDFYVSSMDFICLHLCSFSNKCTINMQMMIIMTMMIKEYQNYHENWFTSTSFSHCEKLHNAFFSHINLTNYVLYNYTERYAVLSKFRFDRASTRADAVRAALWPEWHWNQSIKQSEQIYKRTICRKRTQAHSGRNEVDSSVHIRRSWLD